MLPDEPGPSVAVKDAIASILQGERQDHLAGLAGPGQNAKAEDRFPVGIFPGLNGFYCCKRDLLGGQDIFCPVHENDTPAGEDALERDGLDGNPGRPHEDFFIALEYWLGHATTYKGYIR
jgi:hypothetical protein